MYGFQPKSARGKTVPQLADGGSVPFGSRGVASVRELIPKMAAMGFQPQNAAPSDGTCGCRAEIHAVATSSHAMTYAELNPRGGRAFASVPLPDADWLIYAKVV